LVLKIEKQFLVVLREKVGRVAGEIEKYFDGFHPVSLQPALLQSKEKKEKNEYKIIRWELVI
jgi:hypothetical protein